MHGNLSHCLTAGYHRHAQAAEAASDARRCIAVRPGWGKAHYRLGAALLAQKRLGGAL
eukprot:COSAG01_NODE_34729_length_543_cov_0.682432_1_plen_57_part_10